MKSTYYRISGQVTHSKSAECLCKRTQGCRSNRSNKLKQRMVSIIYRLLS